MNIITRISEAHAHARARGQRRVLVPTMGALHRGHIELIRIARNAAGAGGEVAVSIFVNPLQFAPGSDLDKYPRPIDEDERICREGGVDLLFRPTREEMYRGDGSVYVDETELTRRMEGVSRPGHFLGVCTVVTKLFNILLPDAAVFGEKDFQQLAVIRRMVRDLNFSIEIIAGATVRESDGLACSSRNQYLNPEERAQAAVLSRALVAARESEKMRAHEIAKLAREIISSAPLARTDYVEVVDAETLQPIDVVRRNTVMALAVFFGKTRLIDNMRLR
jgi:pantoate--beta-alanine ligase